MSLEIIKIRNQYPQMNTAMKRIADYIIGDPHEAVKKSSHELAELSGVSDASVTRFVRYMGYENFKAFQLSLATSLSQGDAIEHREPITCLLYTSRCV